MDDQRRDAPLADPAQPGASPNDMPTGLPSEGAPESEPLGAEETAPEGDAAPRRGPEAMPGIPTEGEPPSDG